jgi:hypothetical protein
MSNHLGMLAEPSTTMEVVPLLPVSSEPQRQPKIKAKKKKEASEKQYFEPTNNDVLLGRGGRSNHHPGNQRYLILKEEIQPRYQAATKEAKTDISQELVDRIRQDGGKFLELDKQTNQWFVVTNIKARKKASQSLRENNTPEQRLAKRVKYQHQQANEDSYTDNL